MSKEGKNQKQTCPKCGKEMRSTSQRGWGGTPKPKCPDTNCPSNKPNNGWGG